MHYEKYAKEFIKSIREDYQNGSIALTKKSLLGIKSLNEIFPFDDKNKFLKLIVDVKESKPSMLALSNALNLLCEKVGNLGLPNLNSIIDDILNYIESSTIKTIDVALSYISKFYACLEINVLTTSYSSTFLKFVKELSKLKKLHLFVLESKWQSFDYSASTFNYCKRIGVDVMVLSYQKLNYSNLLFNFAMTGADCVCLRKGIVNGSPTKILAQFCYEKKLPFYVLAERLKFAETCKKDEGFDFVDIQYVSKIFSDE